MEIIVTDVLLSEPECRIAFECECGHGEARWIGAPPAIGVRRFVELEVDALLEVGKNLLETTLQIGLQMEGGVTQLVGEIDRVRAGGNARLVFGCGGIDLETTGPEPVLGQRYQVRVPSLKLFDCEY